MHRFNLKQAPKIKSGKVTPFFIPEANVYADDSDVCFLEILVSSCRIYASIIGAHLSVNLIFVDL